MEGPRVLLLWLIVQTSMVMGLEMKQEIYHVTAEPEGTTELICAADGFSNKCSFTRYYFC